MKRSTPVYLCYLILKSIDCFKRYHWKAGYRRHAKRSQPFVYALIIVFVSGIEVRLLIDVVPQLQDRLNWKITAHWNPFAAGQRTAPIWLDTHQVHARRPHAIDTRLKTNTCKHRRYGRCKGQHCAVTQNMCPVSSKQCLSETSLWRTQRTPNNYANIMLDIHRVLGCPTFLRPPGCQSFTFGITLQDCNLKM
jgi:hypothetical protein